MELSRSVFVTFLKFNLLAEIMRFKWSKMRFLEKFAYDVLSEPSKFTPSFCAHIPHVPTGTFG